MDVEFDDTRLDALEQDKSRTAGHGDAVDRGFRKVMQVIRAAPDERNFFVMRSLNFEKLKGNRSHQHSFRLNDQWRLIVEIRIADGRKRIGVIEIEDYH